MATDTKQYCPTRSTPQTVTPKITKKMLVLIGEQKLKSKKLPWRTAIELEISNFNILNALREDYVALQLDPQNYYKVGSYQTSGYHLPRKNWATLNRIRKGHGKCGYLMHK